MLVINILIIFIIILLFFQIFLATVKEGFTDEETSNAISCCSKNTGSIEFLNGQLEGVPDLKSKIISLEGQVDDLTAQVKTIQTIQDQEAVAQAGGNTEDSVNSKLGSDYDTENTTNVEDTNVEENKDENLL